ncbi:type II secretion system F family protein [Metabacillus sp. GX 13764]|uniref:competence type IV pilus assembly protein ComGB n=1 Tax=Metabacillus kandeliae TaxID=2900151 RepID=UPI001E4CCAEC|nr:competence type IV pilus assembly protein ComGB [Metabacillus kandeliae]MCD7033125.1 type II secretion system F family protein [Metabacillus kandeliae]
MKLNKDWKLSTQAEFMQRLSELLEKGYSLNEGLSFMLLQLKGRRKAALTVCLEELSKGLSISSMFEKLSFDKDVLSYLYFAENHGDLSFALKESANLLSRKCNQAEKLSAVMRYPLFLIFIGGAVIYIAQSVIGPQFLQIYQSMNMEPSLLTKGLMLLFDFIKYALIGLAGSGLLFFVLYFFLFHKLHPQKKMRIAMQIPLINKGFKMLNSYYFGLQLSYLLRGGLSFYESLLIFEKQNYHSFFQAEAKTLISELKKGEAFETVIQNSPFYEKEFYQVIAHGQANGRLERDLYHYSQLVIANLEKKLSKLISVIQPAVFLIVGLIVLSVYLSMMLPMYQMMEHI